MNLEVVSTLTYSCPYCHTELDPPAGHWDGWLRCPSCGRPSLPPEPKISPYIISRAAASSRADDTALDAGSPSGATNLDAPKPLTGRMAYTSPARVVFTTGFVLCLLLALIYFLDFAPGKLTLFGFLTIAFFLLLLRTPRKRLPLAGSSWIPPEGDSNERKD